MTREEAIAILQSMIPTPCRADGKSTTHTLVTIALDMAIKALEQTEPERKTGKWIRGKYWSVGIGMGEQYGYFYKCSECGKEVKGGYTECTDRFCKSCGAKMEVDG